jgi:DNA polymerase-3 subunit epsilon
MNKEDLIFVDIETTGFDPNKHEIIELAYILVRQKGGNGTDFEVIEEREFKIKPEHIETAEPQALKVNGYDEGQWLFASSLSDVMKVFAEKSKGAVFLSHNVTFDYSFIERAFTKTGVKNEMFYAKLDTISMAYAKLHKSPHIERFALAKLCEFFGIENSRSHSALSDTRALFEVYKKLMSL